VTTPVLTSTRNPRVRAASELRTRRGRDTTGLTLVDGVRELSRALDANAVVRDVFTVVEPAAEAAEVVDRARDSGAGVVVVDRRVLDHLGYGERSEDLIAVVEVPDVSLAAIALPPAPLITVVEGVEKPGNLGAVLRTADAVGAACVIAADPRTDLFNPNTIRASLGTVFSVPVAAATAGVVRAWLLERGVRIVAARVDGAFAWSDADLTGPLAIALGSEATGLTDAWRGAPIESVHLPMLGVADSLNVSITAAVLLFEARRQRANEPPAAAHAGAAHDSRLEPSDPWPRSPSRPHPRRG
jgi:TrmH family RNA methyltransferase